MSSDQPQGQFMKSIIFTLSTLLFSATAFAECTKPEDNLFSCTFDNGAESVELCMIDSDPLPKVSYSFGKTGEKPEVIKEAEFEPTSTKEGYYLLRDDCGEDLIINMGGLTYDVDVRDEKCGEPTKTLTIFKDDYGATLSSKTCDKDASATNPFNPLWQKLESGEWEFYSDIGWDKKGL